MAVTSYYDYTLLLHYSTTAIVLLLGSAFYASSGLFYLFYFILFFEGKDGQFHFRRKCGVSALLCMITPH